jgi:hypothetical protein
MRWLERRFTRGLAVVLGFFVLGCLAAMGPGILALGVLPFALLFWAYLLSLALLLLWLVAWRRGLEAPALPYGPARWRGQQRTLYALAGFAFLMTLLREGAFSPDLELNFDLYSNNSSWTSQTNSSFSSNYTTEPVRLAGRFIDCTGLSCSPRGALCEAFERSFSCQNSARVPEGPVASVFGSVSFNGDPFCYTPLYKSAGVSLSGNFTISASSPGGSVGHSLLLSSQLAQTTTGIASCLTFQRLLAQQAAVIVNGEINKIVSSN